VTQVNHREGWGKGSVVLPLPRFPQRVTTDVRAGECGQSQWFLSVCLPSRTSSASRAIRAATKERSAALAGITGLPHSWKFVSPSSSVTSIQPGGAAPKTIRLRLSVGRTSGNCLIPRRPPGAAYGQGRRRRSVPRNGEEGFGHFFLQLRTLPDQPGKFLIQTGQPPLHLDERRRQVTGPGDGRQ
jgi:hypothetical protein